MKRALWKQTLTKQYAPAWPCPSCRRGTLKIVPNSLVQKETSGSQRAHGHENWDPDWVEYTFTAWLKCSGCGEDVVASGVGGIEPGYDQEGMTWDDYFTPRLLVPTPDVFVIPKKCPDEVCQKLRGAFTVFWVDQAAAATRVRVALEQLLNHLGVKRRRKDQNGKLVDLTLHGRIEEFAKRDAVIGAQLMALKWLGNTGSHEGRVTKDDLLDAFEIMEHALVELIDRRSEKVVELAKQLAHRHRKKRK
jgi:hypothetical protein